MENSNAILEKLKCFSDPDYEWELAGKDEILAPFAFQGSSYATNGWIIIRVDGVHIDRTMDTHAGPDLLSTARKEVGNSTTLITEENLLSLMIPCPNCDPSGTRKKIECDECDGVGEVYWESSRYTYEDECRHCNGEGMVWEGDGKLNRAECKECRGSGFVHKNEETRKYRNHAFEFDDFAIDGRFLALFMREFGELTLYAPKHPLKPIYITFEGGDGLVMPLDMKGWKRGVGFGE